MYCKNCGAKLPKDRDYCIRCGGRNELDVAKSFKQLDNPDFQPALPMNFHYFYLVLMFLSIVLDVYAIFVEGFSVYNVINVLLSLFIFVTLGNRKKIGYYMVMISVISSIIMISVFYILMILMLFGINIFNIAFLEFVTYDANFIKSIVILTGIVGIMIAILLAIGKYYKNRKGMFS